MIKILVRNLAYYNNGEYVQHEFTLPMDWDELQEELAEKVQRGMDTDYAIHDYEAPFDIQEYQSIKQLNEWAEVLERSKIDEDSAKAIFDVMDSIQSAITVIEEEQYVIWTDCEDMEDVSIATLEDNQAFHELPEDFKRYFDHEARGRDLEIEGTFTFVSSNKTCIEITR